MKTVCKVNRCAGCMACFDSCPRDAIKVTDSLRAFNAVIDASKCVNCNACYRVCQECSPPIMNPPIKWKEGWAEDSKIRSSSSSGGFAAAIEIAFVKSGGVVCSCFFEKGEFLFTCEQNEDNIKKFSGSKYVKSNPKGIYKKIVSFLKEGKKVLFVGLPCQVAATRKYVGDRDDFYTIDLICHGTPSPGILEAFLNEHQCTLTDLDNINFRVKNDFGIKNDKYIFAAPNVRDNYTTTFLNSTIYTENCYECRYARLERVSDLTLGDSWGSNLSDNEVKKGISLALCQTEKGWELLQQSKLFLHDLDLENAINNNHQLQRSSVKPKQREQFFCMIEHGKKFSHTILKCYPKRYVKDVVKTLLYKLKTMMVQH